jgi:hypothetical protein
VEYATEAFALQIYDVCMGLREIFKPKQTPDEELLPSVTVDRPGWVARSVHNAVAEQVSGSRTERAQATSRTAGEMKRVLDEVLDPPEGAVQITDPTIRNDLEVQREELLRLAQSPELPPDGDNPAA